MPSIRWENTISGSLRLPGGGVHRRAVYGIAARRVSTVGPVQLPSGRHRGPDRSARAGCHRGVRCLGGSPGSGLRELDIRAEDAALARVVVSLLGPVEFASGGVHRNADAPFPGIRARPGIALTRVDEGLDVRPIEVGSHHAHAFPIAPVELAGFLFDLELLGSERAAGSEQWWSCFSRRDPNGGWNRRSLWGCPYWSSTYGGRRCRPPGRPESFCLPRRSS